MKNYLFPHRFKLPGMILFIIGLCLLLLSFFEIYIPDWEVPFPYITYEALFGEREYFVIKEMSLGTILPILLYIIGGLFFGFSKESQEDELINAIRKNSLVWAVYINHIVLLVMLLFIGGFDFFGVIIMSSFSLLLFFIIRFQWKKYQLNTTSDEE